MNNKFNTEVDEMEQKIQEVQRVLEGVSDNIAVSVLTSTLTAVLKNINVKSKVRNSIVLGITEVLAREAFDAVNNMQIEHEETTNIIDLTSNLVGALMKYKNEKTRTAVALVPIIAIAGWVFKSTKKVRRFNVPINICNESEVCNESQVSQCDKSN